MLKLGIYLIQESPTVNEVRFRAGESDNPTVDTRLSPPAGPRADRAPSS